jgi:hypothetical protein
MSSAKSSLVCTISPLSAKAKYKNKRADSAIREPDATGDAFAC